MKHFLLSACAAILLASALPAQTVPTGGNPPTIVVSSGGTVVTATSGDLSCVFAHPPNTDPEHVTCYLATGPGTTKVILNHFVVVFTGHTIASSVTTPDGNFISWKLAHPGPADFTWEIDADGITNVGVF